MSETRPSGGEMDGAAELLASVRARVHAAAADLALPPGLRLTEWQRTTVARLLAGLVGDIEDELRSRLVALVPEESVRAALASAHLAIAGPILDHGNTLADPGLISALLRRAEEHRLQAAGDHGLLGALAGDRDEAVAAEAMSLLILQSSRVDRFGEPIMGRADLAAEHQHKLAWTVAAALRSYLISRGAFAAAGADATLGRAVADLLGRYDEGEGIDARALRLARRLVELKRLEDGLVARLPAEAGLPFLLAALAVRTGLGTAEAWDLLAEPSGRGALLLLRAAGMTREAAAEILLHLGTPENALPARLDVFDTLAWPEAGDMLDPWRADAAYRNAVLDLAR